MNGMMEEFEEDPEEDLEEEPTEIHGGNVEEESESSDRIMSSENSSNSRTNDHTRLGEFRGKIIKEIKNHLGEDGALECFLKFNPFEYVGEPNDEKAEAWIEHMGSIFVTLKYEDERKIAFATFQLRGIARE
ncbi:hypothetical protein ACH5RR_028890 [Cinchona calisaya]|uniref:Uncharacterized protein n=1 Tax=Cinchona calisaya TaxID=153742 RepID=A0ABD2YQ32_9GENT